ncbi:MAG: hypothetical protein M0Z32_01040 [Actinomycetota bacterium]|nr:hypothetical protein [Actinomycetota bacterium]MCL6093544.1 hypothetical protein [Actinomycetota bacterium]MDA8166330.1 hypothetical protein [Actinomycetota bacterium]
MGAVVAIITVVGTLIVISVIAWLILKKMKAGAWQGIVTVKDTSEIEGSDAGGSSISYYVVVTLDNGEQKRVRLGKKIWGVRHW